MHVATWGGCKEGGPPQLASTEPRSRPRVGLPGAPAVMSSWLRQFVERLVCGWPQKEVELAHRLHHRRLQCGTERRASAIVEQERHVGAMAGRPGCQLVEARKVVVEWWTPRRPGSGSCWEGPLESREGGEARSRSYARV